MNRLIVSVKILLAVIFMAATTPSANADERIPFERGGLRGSDWEFFKDYLDTLYPLIVKFVAEDYSLSRDAAWQYLRKNFLYVGRFDVNGDGSEEMFVSIRHGYVCGQVGCETPIFEMTPNGWQELSSITTTISTIDGIEAFASDEVIDGYRTLYSDYYGLRWDGELYDGFCRRDCTRG